MKKLSIGVLAVFVILAFLPSQALAISKTAAATGITATDPEDSELIADLNNRLNEISQIDRSDLSRSEKKDLRKEVRAIKSELKALNGGIYLSIGTIILVALILILVL